MTVAATQDFGALLGKSGFDLSAFGAAMSPSAAQPTPSNYVETAPDQNIGVGQMKAETPETAAAIDNLAAQPDANLSGLDSIRKGLEEKAAALEGQALEASDPKGAAAMQAELDDRAAAALVSKSSKTPEFDKNINKMLGLKGNVGGIEGLADMPKLQGAEVSAADIGNLEAQSVGSQQRSQSQGQGR